MTRDSVENYKQDRLGNSRKELDTLRAQEGKNGLGNDDGLVEIQGTGANPGNTGVDTLIYSLPTHAQQAIITQITAFNSLGSGDNTFTIAEADLGSGGSVTSTTQRSVPMNVGSGSTQIFEYEGLPFDKAIAVNSEFQGQIGVAVISDHQEGHESASEQTGT